jgi:ribosomal protein S7
MKKFKKEYIDEEVKALSEIIGKIIKKTSYTKFEKSIKNINPEIKTLIYDITNDGFKYEKYVKTPYFNTTDNAMKMFGM